MNILRHASLALAALMLTMSVEASEQGSIGITDVSEGIYMLSGNGGNIGLMIGDDGTFLIDDQYAPATPDILAAIESKGGTTPKFLVNTHYHGDHTGGNENLGKQGTLIMAHENVRKQMAAGYTLKVFNKTEGPAPKDALPVVTYQKELGLHINGESIRVQHVKDAHTHGDSIIIFPKANVIHTGDLFFNGFYPFIDTDHGGSLKGMIDAADLMLGIVDEDTKIMPGHGPLATKADLLEYRNMLQTAFDRLSALKAKGLTANEAAATKPLEDLEDKWGQVLFNSERWIWVVYNGLN